MARAFEERGYETQQAGGYDRGASRSRRPKRALSYAVVDLRMPGKSGFGRGPRAALGSTRRPRIVVLTGYGSIATALEAMRLGATHYLTKPADVDEVIAAFLSRRRVGSLIGGRRIPEAGARPETPSLARVEWEHIQRVLDRLRRQHHQGLGKTRDSPTLAPAQAREVPHPALTRSSKRAPEHGRLPRRFATYIPSRAPDLTLRGVKGLLGGHRAPRADVRLLRRQSACGTCSVGDPDAHDRRDGAAQGEPRTHRGGPACPQRLASAKSDIDELDTLGAAHGAFRRLLADRTV